MSATASLRPALSAALLRNCSAAEVGARARSLGFEGIEWSDVHVPPGDIASAREAARVTRDTGLELVSYQSPYRLLLSHGEGKKFSDSIETAAALGAPCILLRAGFKASTATTPVEQGLLRREVLKAVEEAAGSGIAIVFEFRKSTWCDSAKSALALAAVAPQCRLDWALLPGTDPLQAGVDLADVAPHLASIHVNYHDSTHRLVPLADGVETWSGLLSQPALAGIGAWAVLDRSSGGEGNGLKSDTEALFRLLGRA